MSLTIREILKGTEPGEIQTVGHMQVIPLLSDIVDNGYISPEQDESEFATENYGVMSFENKSDKTMIVPNGAMYVTKQAAQDHAMTHAGIVEKKRGAKFNTAACVQETQSGFISRGRHKMMMLPYSLREIANNNRTVRGYNKLWGAIRAFNQDLGVKTRAHLEYFLDHYKKELDQFVAEFETVPQQVGAIVLIDGKVAGVERTPSHKYWESVWPALIRECYGSLSIQVDKEKNGKIDDPKTRSRLNTNVKTVDELYNALVEAEKDQEGKVREVIRKLIDDKFEVADDQIADNLKRNNIKNKQFVGQIIRDGEKIIYASLTTTGEWAKNQDWHEASEFDI